MQAMADALPDENIPIIAAYLSALPRVAPTAVLEGDLKNANNY